uniref:Uncharacterized protein n=1 Tax=Pseudomonas aeruginosa TaxID=287 RepID=A0A6H1QAM0_PSEAI|nr:Hypothetical protein [Pseudomonas aeruginosa]
MPLPISSSHAFDISYVSCRATSTVRADRRTADRCYRTHDMTDSDRSTTRYGRRSDGAPVARDGPAFGRRSRRQRRLRAETSILDRSGSQDARRQHRDIHYSSGRRGPRRSRAGGRLLARGPHYRSLPTIEREDSPMQERHRKKEERCGAHGGNSLSHRVVCPVL